MSLRFRKGLRLGPLRLNFTANGLSSVSLGGRGATVNVPIGRSGPARATASIPGTGLSWSEPIGRPSTRQRRQAQQGEAGQPTTQQLVDLLQNAMVGPENVGDTLWHQHGVGLVQVLLQREDTPRSVLEACALVQSWDRCELHVRRGRGQADTLRRARQVADAAQLVVAHGKAIGIVQP
jgi:hypothetical protein